MQGGAENNPWFWAARYLNGKEKEIAIAFGKACEEHGLSFKEWERVSSEYMNRVPGPLTIDAVLTLYGCPWEGSCGTCPVFRECRIAMDVHTFLVKLWRRSTR